MHDLTSQPITMIDSSPPLQHHYGELTRLPPQIPTLECNDLPSGGAVMEEYCQLPLIDLSCLNSTDERERLACAEAICRASSEWGFFQVVNHGISPELVRNMRREQVKLFQTPFDKKATCGVLNNSYRWGTPTATCPKQFSWSEAFHIPLSRVSEQACYGEFSSLREVMMEFAAAMSKLSRVLAGVLAENLGHPRGVFENICQEINCFLRLNRYPACPISSEIFGLVPHTDSDFLTILSQDEVGGLQLMKDSKWVAVNPNQDALIVNIGDLFQVWSNDVYKSVEHKVVANGKTERYSIAYFLCPSFDSLVGSCMEPSIYRKFTFGEYRSQVQEDVKRTGRKIGLPRFLL
ncbi:gibberellin 2-beta-dioxygenase 6-like [Populus alba x Populus x berolinensis]|nr:gibberellin 2-beta-dioxygenase 6-like [Populus alba x Populus x berolinensis]